MRLTAHSRPAAACLCVTLGGMELAALPLARPGMLGLQGLSAATAVLLALALVGCAVHLWTRPARTTGAGVTVILLGLLSYPLANLGGFLLGMLLALTGGALALSWRSTDTTSADCG
ncbi:DUF6114 domain-containing protein (plasmid) [Streptomyces sp. CA-294286]|uniref:DUF6114 domain-containing protein n=1 Tax=Streptomyces sp. CA-294286 TaxID=3240070 RepID=UPI003D9030E8